MEVPDILNFKIIVVGFQGTGKPSLVTCYIKASFQSYNITVGVEYSSKIVKVDPVKQIRLQIWDTVISMMPQAVKELFHFLVKLFYKGITAVFFVNSVDSRLSFDRLKSWSDEVKQYAHEQAAYFLIAAKAGIKDKREVCSEQADIFLKKIGGIIFLETSDKTGLNINSKADQELIKKYEMNDSFKNLVSPNVIETDEGSRGQGELLMLRRSTIQKELVINRKQKCCE